MAEKVKRVPKARRFSVDETLKIVRKRASNATVLEAMMRHEIDAALAIPGSSMPELRYVTHRGAPSG